MELSLIFEIVVLGVPFLAGLVYLIEEAILHQKPLRRLANAKLIGLGILVASLYFGLTTTGPIVLTSDGLMSSLPTVLLTLLGMDVGLDIMWPKNQGL